MWQFINEFTPIIASVITGAVAYRQMTLFNRFLFFQVLTWLFIFLMSYTVTLYQKWQHVNPNNQWVLNLSMPLETSLLAMGAYHIFKRPTEKIMAVLFTCLFLATSVVILIAQGISRFNVSLYVLESFVVLILYLMVFYRLFHSINTRQQIAEIWMCSGLIIYFCCNLPYFCFMNYLNEHHLDLSKVLFHIITDVLANLRYYCLAIGFWLIFRTQSIKNLRNG